MIIAIIGKDGSGKSTFAANLAASLAAKGKSTLLVNADFAVGNAQLFFRELVEEEKDYRKLIYESSNNKEDIDFYITEVGKQKNLFLLTIASLNSIVPTAPVMLDPVENTFNKAKSMFEHIIIDTADILQPISLYAIAAADIVLQVLPQTISGAKWAIAHNDLITSLCRVTNLQTVASQNVVGVGFPEFNQVLSRDVSVVLPYVNKAPEMESLGQLLINKNKAYKQAIERVATNIIMEGGLLT